MSERVLEYNAGNFPISGIFADLTEQVRSTGMEPLEALTTFDDQLAIRGLGRRILDYDSTSITTGGHARVPGKGIGEVIAANTRTARQIITVLEAAGAVEASESMLAPDLGKTGWDQTRYMGFWLMANAGPDLRAVASRPAGLTALGHDVQQQLETHGVDLAVMGDMSLDREARRPEYVKFARAYADTVKGLERSGIPMRPVRRFLSLVDPGISLGCYAERVFADTIGIPRFRVIPVQSLPVESAPDAVASPVLQEDLRIIQAHGGSICVAGAGARLILQRDSTPIEEEIAA